MTENLSGRFWSLDRLNQFCCLSIVSQWIVLLNNLCANVWFFLSAFGKLWDNQWNWRIYKNKLKYIILIIFSYLRYFIYFRNGRIWQTTIKFFPFLVLKIQFTICISICLWQLIKKKLNEWLYVRTYVHMCIKRGVNM